MKQKLLIIEWLVVVLLLLTVIGNTVYKIDPFMHFHKPRTDSYFYQLDNERSQNDGISKHFDYDALITGTSMTENFKASEMDAIFGVHSIKVPFSGGSYKEINDNIRVALKHNPKLAAVVRCLDMDRFFDTADNMRTDLGKYPTYLYDNNPFNDVEYVFNRDVIWGRAYSMKVASAQEGFEPGMTSFDDYARWQYSYVFGKNTVLPEGIHIDSSDVDVQHLSDEEKVTIKENIAKNVTDLADEYPDVDFYYFFPPYSVVWWAEKVNVGSIYKQVEAEKYIIELIIGHPNIRLYSFNNRTDITSDLNNYKDSPHYGQWINSLMLKWMHEGKYLLTRANYEKYLKDELAYYVSFDYGALDQQEDYEADFYAAALLNEELTEKKPEKIINGTTPDCQIKIDDIKGYDYLVFYARNIDSEQALRVCDADGQLVYEKTSTEGFDGNKWHQFAIELDKVKTNSLTICNNYYIYHGIEADAPVFKDIGLY